MNIEYSLETVFSFEGPNLCFLGDEHDFKLLAISILSLTDTFRNNQIRLFAKCVGDSEEKKKEIIFASKANSGYIAVARDEKIIFELDSRNWERLFKYFVLMSWEKRTYYLNADEDCLIDLDLEQDCNFICSSEF